MMSISPFLGHASPSEPYIQKAGQTGLCLPSGAGDNLIRASTRLPYVRLPAGPPWVVTRADLNRGLPLSSSPTLLIVKASALPSLAAGSSTTFRVSCLLVYFTLLLLGS